MQPGLSPPLAAEENIRVIAELEQEFRRQRTTPERIADAIAAFTGSFFFSLLHVCGFALYILVNSGWAPFLRPFDPFPFVFLALIVSCEAVLLSSFVLMKQNRMSAGSDRRAHLNLQIDLLAEKEITKLLQLQRMICDRLGIREAAHDEEARDMSQNTAVDSLADQLKIHIPAD
ncbi:MAG: DUF1003 domain-containing protein [Bryobacteraceae bacterium]|nr:DUF1003 domain-containing protein [Bryobacteraceae bacterium]